MPDLASNPVYLVFCVSPHDCGTVAIVPLLYKICNNDGYDTGVCEPSTARFGKIFSTALPNPDPGAIGRWFY
jgi:hypothetical protein